jgi:hypothetical protein
MVVGEGQQQITSLPCPALSRIVVDGQMSVTSADKSSNQATSSEEMPVIRSRGCLYMLYICESVIINCSNKHLIN